MSERISTLSVRVKSDVKQEAQQVLSDLGMDMSTAVNLFLRQVIISDGIPFPIQREKKPGKRLLAAIKEAELLSKDLDAPTFGTMEELLRDLNA